MLGGGVFGATAVGNPLNIPPENYDRKIKI
jgi:hypothetical protein